MADMEYSEEYMRDYLLGKLSQEESTRLEEEIESDPELAESLELQRDIMIGIRAGFDDELRKKLLQVEEQEAGTRKSLTGRRILWQWASAAAVVLGTLGVYFYMNQTTAEERIFLTYFEDFPNIIQPVQRDQPGQSEAFVAYQNQNYAEAYKAFAEEEISTPQSTYPSFYKGICAMHLENWTQAIEAFEKVRSDGDPRFEEAAAWYVALAYLRTSDRERGILILETIADTQGSFQRDAQAVLDHLR